MSIEILEVKKKSGQRENEINKDSADSQRPQKIVIVGLPNTGKSQVFNNLTGKYNVVANYPLTTVEIIRTHCRIGNQFYEVIDTPGLHCLYIHSEEELIVRDMIFTEKPDIIIQCIDANRLKQSLTLTADLLELQIPMVISLNAIDETSRKGIWIDSAELSRLFGVPVVESVAINGVGTQDIKDAIAKARRGKWDIQYGRIIEDGMSVVEAMLPEDVIYKRKLSSLLLLNDPFLVDYLRKVYGTDIVDQLNKEVDRIRWQFGGNVSRVVNNKRGKWVDDIIGRVNRKREKDEHLERLWYGQ